MSDSPRTRLGKRLSRIRQRIAASGTVLRGWDELTIYAIEAVEAERKRFANVIDEVAIEAHKSGDTDAIFRLRQCRDRILASEPEPSPPATEPEMTIERLIEKWRLRDGGIHFWLDMVTADLTALVQDQVQAQARRDAKVIREAAPIPVGESLDWLADLILKSAGLK